MRQHIPRSQARRRRLTRHDQVHLILERRQQIGMMRAIGCQRSQVTRSLLLEGFFTALLGAVVGV
jgi:ABC-type lipoprotein release transport system permease subunit